MGMSAALKSAPPLRQTAQTVALHASVGATHPLVEDLKRTALMTLGRRLDHMFSVAGDTLIALSDCAATEAERHAHFEAMRVMGFEQASITRSFALEIARGFGGLDGSEPLHGPSDMRRTLLPEQELEEGLALARASSQAKARSKKLADAFEQRLQALDGNQLRAATRSALSPRRYCEAYCASLNKLDLGYSVRKLMRKLFETQVLDDLSEVYQDLHAALDRHSPRVEPPPAAHVAGSSESRTQLLARVQRVVAYELMTLINGRRLHPGARRFLCCAMAPLMSVRLLRHGVHSKLWHDALSRVSHILRSLEPSRQQPEHGFVRTEYMDAVASDLKEIGFNEVKITELLNALQEAYAEVDHAPQIPQGLKLIRR